uniref:Conserved secreted protein n=1 Tax=Rhabditophanes sp. KR3021 TaxID=114890 RepID=A0AC35U6T7_9BILA
MKSFSWILVAIILASCQSLGLCDADISTEDSKGHVQESTALTPKDKTINRVTALVSDFLSKDQLNTVATAFSVLKPTQISKAFPVYTTLSSALADKLPVVISNMTTVGTNNLMPFITQVLAQISKMEANKKGKTAISNKVYSMINQFFTRKRARTIFIRVKDNIDPAVFTTVYQGVKTFVKIDLIADLL